jgi:organic hydroperoxide reductase OsmC/OhrA
MYKFKVGDILVNHTKDRWPNKVEVVSIEKEKYLVKVLAISEESLVTYGEYLGKTKSTSKNVLEGAWKVCPVSKATKQFDKDLEEILK